MIFHQTALEGAFLIQLDKHEDTRGFFGRSFCQREYEAHGLNPRIAQCNISFNTKSGTLRGLHYQSFPYQEAKLVRCTEGAIYDVIVDLRPTSPSFKKYAGFTLIARNHDMVYVPEGFAHGFLTLQDNSEVFYQMSQFYVPRSSNGIRWNDPAFGIKWPSTPLIISERDQSYPDYIF